MSLLSSPSSSWSLGHSPVSCRFPYSSSTLRSKPPRATTTSSSSYFLSSSSSASINIHSHRKTPIGTNNRGRETDVLVGHGGPVRLTSFRDLSESRLSSRSVSDSLTPGMRRLSVTDLTSGYLDVNGNLKKMGHERSLSGCSQISGENLTIPSPASSDSGMTSRSITPTSSYHYRTLGSSNSSVDSIEVAAGPIARHRLRRVSSASGESSSGVSIGSRGSARSYSSRNWSSDDSENNNNANCCTIAGLRNLGNSCFMNSTIQCLIHTAPLADYFKGSRFTTDVNTTSQMRGDLAQVFATLLSSMWSNKDGMAISPTDFRSQIQKYAPRFMGYSQQDSQEFLTYLLQGLHEDVNRIKVQPRGTSLPCIDEDLSDEQKAAECWRRYLRIDDSRIVDLFVGMLKSTLRCSMCGHKSVTFDPFWDLSLPIPESSRYSSSSATLQQCLELYTTEEVLDGHEKPTCSRCKKRQRMTKNLSIWKCPKILVLHLKRFSNSERYRSKLDKFVQYPLKNLDMSAFVANGCGSQLCKYNLYAVSNHSGSTHSGHYTAACFNTRANQWFLCNDSSVSEIDEDNVVSAEGYLLFYELSGGSTYSRL